MGMEAALQALTAANAAKDAAPTMPTNMANTGANIINQEPQAAQETKENATDSSQMGTKDGVVDAQSSTAEATASEPAKTEPAPEPISKQFAALAKKEKTLVKLQADIKAKEASFSEREAAIAAREAKIKESEALWETDVLAALESKGYSYQKLTDMILSGKVAPEKAPEDPVTIANKKIEALEKKIEEREANKEAAAKKAQEEEAARVAAEEAAAYEAFRGQIGNFITEKADTYELISIYGQQEMVLQEVEDYFEQHKRVLSIQEAADIVEKKLEAEIEKARKAKKFQTKSEPTTKAEAIKEAASAPATKAPAQTKTLSNNLTPTMASTLPAATDSERMKRALEKLNATQR